MTGMQNKESAECIKTIVSLKDGTRVIVYVPIEFDATEHLNYYDQLFKINSWQSWMIESTN